MIVLYEHPSSPYAQKVKILLIENGLAFEARMPGLADLRPDSEYSQGSPRGEVPLLVDGETFGYGDACVYPFISGAAGRGCPPPAGTRLAH